MGSLIKTLILNRNLTKFINIIKEEIYYEIQYIKNTKSGKRGEIKERGYKIENISYKVI